MIKCANCHGVGWRDGAPCHFCEGAGTVADPEKIVRPTDPVTSHEAAVTVDLKGDRKLVFDAIRANEAAHPEGFTRAEIAEIVVYGHVQPQGREERARVESLRRRVSDFVEVVEETGAKRGREALLRLKEVEA
jgi:hypothetical protein